MVYEFLMLLFARLLTFSVYLAAAIIAEGLGVSSITFQIVNTSWRATGHSTRLWGICTSFDPDH